MVLVRILLSALGFLVSAALWATPAAAEEGPGMVEVRYLGHRGYASFTRLAFDTGGMRPETFKVNYDQEGRRVVFYPSEGLLAFSFAPVSQVDELVREVDFVEDEEGKRGIVIRLGQAANGLKVSSLSEPSMLVLDIYARGAPAPFLPYGRAVRTVAVDPGHGGRFTGSGAPGGLSEKDLALDIAVRLRKELVRRGYGVVMTRESDQEVSPDQRAGLANSARADAFVSLHAGGPVGQGAALYTMDTGELDGGAGRGGPLLWSDQNAPYLPDSIRLAKDIRAALGKVDGAEPGLHHAPLAGFEGLMMPAALLELGSLSDPAVAASLADDSFRNKLAERIAAGVEDFAKGVTR